MMLDFISSLLSVAPAVLLGIFIPPITKVHEFGEDISSTELPPWVGWGQDYDIAIRKSLGLIWQKLGAWTQVFVSAVAIGKVWQVGEAIGGTQTVDGTFGANGDVIVYKGSGVVKQKVSGTWSQVWPTPIG